LFVIIESNRELEENQTEPNIIMMIYNDVIVGPP